MIAMAMTPGVIMQPLDDFELLEELKEEIFWDLMTGGSRWKVTDLIKVIEMKNKVKVFRVAEIKLWDIINKLREEKLPLLETNNNDKEDKQ
jgi:hypothetical protein